MNLWKQCFSLVIDAPSDHTHLCCIPKSSGLALNSVLLVRAMEKIVTGLTQGDEVIRAITAHLSRLDMMHIQDRVFGLAFTPLAAMPITKGHTHARSRSQVAALADIQCLQFQGI